jgi:multiple antibiotic resistance protein
VIFGGSGFYSQGELRTVDYLGVLSMVAQLVAIIDPVGALPIIMSIPGIAGSIVRVARVVLIAVPSVLILFATLGPYILGIFNIGIDDFRIAGGIVILIIGIDMLREGAPRTMGISLEDYVLVPIVTPMLVGPGAITSVMLFATYHGLIDVVVSILIASTITYVVIRLGVLLTRVLGVNILRFMGRFMSLIIMAWAVSLITSGVADLASII